jgi:RimJ/RimL family protein N-acetyltransferase
MAPPTIDAGPLTLRPFCEADIAWVCEVSQDPAIQRSLAGVFAPYRMEHAAYFVRRLALAAWDEGKRAEFLVADAASGTRLGRVGLDLRPDDPGSAEIGYWMDPRSRNQGVATTAVRVLCQWIFTAQNLALIEWRCEVGNLASRRVAEKVGFLLLAGGAGPGLRRARGLAARAGLTVLPGLGHRLGRGGQPLARAAGPGPAAGDPVSPAAVSRKACLRCPSTSAPSRWPGSTTP